MEDPRETRAAFEAECRSLLDLYASLSEEPDPDFLATPAETDARYRYLLEQMRAMTVEVDRELRIAYVSPTCREILGRAPADLRGAKFLDHVHEADFARLLAAARAARTAGRASKLLFRWRHARGHWVWMQTEFTRNYRAADGSVHNVSFSRDVTDVQRASSALLDSEERYRVVTEASRDLITEMDARGRVTYVSANCEQVLGYPAAEILGTIPFHLLHPGDRAALATTYRERIGSDEPVVDARYRARHGDGSWRWFEGAGLSYRRADGERRYLAVTRDVTERVHAEQERSELEARMQQAQKLESLGVMAGGIAHDFNNLLTPILGDTSLAAMDLPSGSPLRARLLNIQKAAHRAAALTDQLLAYAGEGPLAVEPLDVSTLVEEMARLLESAVSGVARLSYELERGLPPVEADAAQLSQVVMNLITNAAEALGEGGGEIAVRAGRIELGAEAARRAVLGAELAAGPHVFFEVEDTGCGMDGSTRARIFDPFFTTKFTGRGLGLAAALGIVRGHRGAIELETEPGRGTRFRVLLPASAGERAAVRRRAESAPLEDWRGSGLVLVIDDDAGVRELAGDALRRAGFEVLMAADGREGVESFRKRAGEIRAVLLDRTMPSIGGEQAFEEIRRIRPDARVILVSGYSEERAAQRLVGRGLAGFLKKPFLPSALLAKLRDALEA